PRAVLASRLCSPLQRRHLDPGPGEVPGAGGTHDAGTDHHDPRHAPPPATVTAARPRVTGPPSRALPRCQCRPRAARAATPCQPPAADTAAGAPPRWAGGVGWGRI